MSPRKNNGAVMIKTTDLQTPEGGMVPLETREDAEDDLKARIARARTLQPKDNERHCLDCFERGRNAAIRVIEGEP